MSLVFKTVQTEGSRNFLTSWAMMTRQSPQYSIRDRMSMFTSKWRANAGVAITHIFETHIHADLVSGSRELCARVKSAKIYAATKAAHHTDSNTRK
jgi:hydroxyacylglutathione hydrolase